MRTDCSARKRNETVIEELVQGGNLRRSVLADALGGVGRRGHFLLLFARLLRVLSSICLVVFFGVDVLFTGVSWVVMEIL